MADDYTLMTTDSMALVLNNDGCCVRHPSVRLKEYDENGDVFLKEACPRCQEEFQETQNALLQKRKELDSQLQDLSFESLPSEASATRPDDERHADKNHDSNENNGKKEGGGQVPSANGTSSNLASSTAPTSTIPPPPPSSMSKGDLSLEGLAGHMLHIQQMQDILMFQKDKEVVDLKLKVDQQQKELTEKQVEIALLKERMAHQKADMERELRLIKRAVAMDREKRLHQSQGQGEQESPYHSPTTMTHKVGKDIHIAELHVHSPSPNVAHVQQAAATVAHDYVMTSSKDDLLESNSNDNQVGVEDKYGAADSDDIHDDDDATPETANRAGDNMAGAAVAAAAATSTAAASRGRSPTPKDVHSSVSTSSSSSSDHVKSPPPPASSSPTTTDAKVVEHATRDIHFIPTPQDDEKAAAAAPSATLPERSGIREWNGQDREIHYVPPDERPPAQLKVAPAEDDDEEDRISLNDEFIARVPEDGGGVAKLPDDIWQDDDEDDKVESEEEDDFDDRAIPIEHAGEAPTSARKNLTSSSRQYKKPGPLMSGGVMGEYGANSNMKNDQQHRGNPMRASLDSLQPPGPTTTSTAAGAATRSKLQPASNVIPTVSEFSGARTDNGPVHELEFDKTMPPEVPLSEQVTLGSLEDFLPGAGVGSRAAAATAPSNRFHPRSVGAAGAGAADEVTVGQTTVGPTVASSTYGEDRQWVQDNHLLDPYGDKGIYTGVVLMSTGLPHGNGKMVYEDDGRTYDGDWRHGRWNGWGCATFSNGDSFEGYYKYDQRHGQGKYCWKDGRVYEGEFKEDKRHGKGCFHWPDGAQYIGDFSDGQRHGQGEYRFSDGGRYVGDWVGGRYEGYGECVWADGRVYKGQWKAGMAHGQGTETYPDGRIRHAGQWIQDEPIREK